MRYAPAIACLLVFLALAAAMISGAMLPFDMSARSAVHSLASSDLTELAKFFSFIGSAFVWVPATLVAISALSLTRRYKQARAIGGSLFGAVLLDNGLKVLFHRARPEVFFGVSPDTYSFPSGHSLFATCFYGTLAAALTREFESALRRTIVWGTAVLTTLCIGWSRIYLGMHYPSDVLAGYLVGTAWLALLCGVGVFRFP
jgi:undecaprenyl-diphosphatase